MKARFFLNPLIGVFLGVFLSWDSHAQLSRAAGVKENRAFIYHGKIVRPDGSTPTGSATLSLKVTSPDPGLCVLWAETQTVNLNQGSFTVEIGHEIHRASGAAGGAAANFRQVFVNNAGLTHSGATCASGNSYTPTSADDRLLFATFNDGGAVVEISGLPIKSVPFALQAEEIGGYGLSNLVKISGAGSNVVFSTGEVQSLSDLLGGDLQWNMKSRRVTNVANPTLATDAVNKAHLDAALAAISLTSSAITTALGYTPLNKAGDSMTGVLGLHTVTGTPAGLGPTDAGKLWFDTGSGEIKFWNGTSAVAVGISSGGLTSLGISAPSIFQVAGSPLTANGTIALSLANQNANQVFAGPSSAGAAAPTFRALADTDIPSLNTAKLTAGTLPVARGGTGIAPAAGADANKIFGLDAAGTGGELKTLTQGSGVTITQGVGTVTISATGAGGTVTNVVGISPISVTSGSTTPNISIAQATGAVSGYLSSGDFTTFTNKLSAVAGHTLASGKVWIGNGSNQAAEQWFGVDDLKTSTGLQQFAASCTAAQTLTWSAVTDAFSCTDISLGAAAVGFAASNRLLGRATAGAGAAEELTIGAGLQLTGTTLSASGAADNLGNHTATTNLNLGAHQLVGNGGASGISVGATGNVGVGTPSPHGAGNGGSPRILNLHQDSGQAVVSLTTNSTAASSWVGSVSFATLGTAGSEKRGALIGSSLTADSSSNVFGDLRFYTGNGAAISSSSPQLMITSSGNVGIGTGNPGSIFAISSSAPQLTIKDTASDNATAARGGLFKFYDSTNVPWAYIGDGASGTNFMDIGTMIAEPFRIMTNNAERIRVESGGNVGIGTTSPTQKLDVNGTAKATAFIGDGSGLTAVTATSFSGTLGVASGGTGATTLTDHGVLLGSGAGAVSATAAGTAGQILRSGGAAADPAWSTATFPATTAVNELLFSSAANSVGGLATANTGALVTSSTGVPSWTSGATANRVLRTNGTAVSFGQVALTTDVTGTLPVANGGTGATTLTGYLSGNGTSAVTASTTIPGTAISGNIAGNAANVTGTVALANGGTGQTTKAAAFDALSPMTTLGDLAYFNGTDGARLPGNTTAVKQFLAQTGTGTVSAAPAWSAINATDVTNAVINGGNSGATAVGTTTAANLTLETNNATRVTVTSAGSVGVGTTTPSAKLDVAGEVKFGNTASTCNATNEGQQRYNSTSNLMEFCNGTAWTSMGSGGGGSSTFHAQFITSGTSWTSPAGITAAHVFKVTLVGGGGGGGGGKALVSKGTVYGAGGGGGAGAVVIWYVSGLTASTAYSISIGTAGAAGAATPGAGGNGTATTMTVGGVTATAGGGAGGALATGSGGSGGSGGTATNGTIPLDGQEGGDGETTPLSGQGASGPLGTGGYSSGNAAGKAGKGYGSGGSGGGSTTSTGRAGGAGRPGMILIESVY